MRASPFGSAGAKSAQAGGGFPAARAPGSKRGGAEGAVRPEKLTGRRGSALASTSSRSLTCCSTAADFASATPCWARRCASLAAFSRSLASLACSFAWRSASRRCAAMRRSHSERPPPPGTAVTLRSQMRTMTCTTITALHDQKKRLVFVSSLNVLADCMIAMYDLG